MNRKDHLDRVVIALSKTHAEYKEPITLAWSGLKFDAPPDRKTQQLLVKRMKEEHNLILLCLPKPLPNGSELAVLTEEELTAAGGMIIPQEQMEDVAAMLDYNVEDMADFMVQKAEGKLKGDPTSED